MTKYGHLLARAENIVDVLLAISTTGNCRTETAHTACVLLQGVQRHLDMGNGETARRRVRGLRYTIGAGERFAEWYAKTLKGDSCTM